MAAQRSPIAWTAETLAEALRKRPEDVLLPPKNGSNQHERSHAIWRWYDYAGRLVWLYGFDGALARLAPELAEVARAS